MHYWFKRWLLLNILLISPMLIQAGALHDAASKGDNVMINKLLDNGSDVNEKDQRGGTALTSATWAGKINSVRVLLSRGARLDPKNGESSLHMAAYKGHLKIFKLLLDEGANIEAKDSRGHTAIRFVIERRKPKAGRIEMLTLLLNQGANLNTRNLEGETPLINAAKRNKIEIVKFLLSRGARVDDRDDSGGPAIFYAVFFQRVAVTKLLLANKADINFMKNHEWTLLSLVAGIHANREILELLINSGTNVNAKGVLGNTALHLVTSIQNKEGVEFLLSKGADKTIKAHDGKTALDIAKNLKDKAIIKLLE